MEVVFIVCCVWNYFRAKAANLNAWVWTFYTLLGVLVGWFIGLMISSLILIAKDPQLQQMMLNSVNPDRAAIMHYLQKKNLLLIEVFGLFCGFGGYLFVRNLITKRTKLG